MLLTILILTYRRPKRCSLFLNSLSLITKNFGTQVEILVIDDSGIKSDEKILLPEYKLEYICHSRNIGYAESLLHGISLANGKYLLHLADDDLLSYDGFSELIDILNSCNLPFYSTYFKFKQGNGARGRRTDSYIYPDNFFESSFHAPGLVYNTKYAKAAINLSIFQSVKTMYFFKIFPQSIIVLCLLCFEGPGMWLPVELVLEHNPEPSNLKDSEGQHYKSFNSRLKQLNSFYQILNTFKGSINKSDYLDVLHYWDQKTRGDILSLVETELPGTSKLLGPRYYFYANIFLSRPIKSTTIAVDKILLKVRRVFSRP